MKDPQKSKTQLITELQDLRKQILELENPGNTQQKFQTGVDTTTKDFSENLLDTANTVVVTLDSEARITIFNQYAQKLTGYSKDEVIGKNWFDVFIPTRDKAAIPNVFKDALEQMPDASQHENPILTKSGEERLISWNNNVLRDTSGKINGLLSIGMDITERKLAEKALRESEEENRSLLDLAPDSFFQGDEKGNLIRVNTKASELTGYTKEELLTLNISDLFTKESLQNKALRYDLLNSGAIITNEREIKRKDGTIAHIEMKSRLMPDKTYQSFFRDITERKQSEETLRKSEEQLRLITENTSDNIGITTFDLKATYVYANSSVKSLLGYDPEYLLGKSFFDFIHPDDKKVLIPLLKKYVQQKIKKILSGRENEICETIEYRFKNKIGNWRFMQSTVNIIGNQLLAVTRDITERKRADKIQNTLYNISSAVNTTENMDVLFIRIRDYLGNVIDTTNFYVALYDEKSDTISLPFVTDEKDIYKSFPAGKTLTHYVIKSGKRLFATKQLLDKLTRQGKIEIIGTRSEVWMGVPLKIENNVIGLIAVQSYNDPNLYTEKDLDILDFVSEEIALAIRHKQVEKDLRDSEEKFSETANLLPQIVYESDISGNITFSNKQGFDSFGFSHEEYEKGINILQTLIPEDRDRAKENIQNILSGKNDGSAEYTALRKDGSTFQILMYSRAIIKNNKPVGLRGIAIDITERKQAEDTLRKSEERLRLITENTTDNIAITTFDLKATYIYVNPSIISVLGYAPEDLLGKSFFDFIHPDDKKSLFPLLKKYVQQKIKKLLSGNETKISETIEFRIKNKMGNWRFMQSTVNIVGKQLLAVTRDITEHKQAQDNLAESEARFRSLFENNQAVMLLIDPEHGTIVDVNSAACSYYGWTRTEMLYKNINEINTLTKQELREEMKRALHQKRNHFEFRHRRADGSIREVDVYSGPVQFHEKELLYSLIFDITERKQAEKKLLENENKMRLIVEGTPNLFFYTQNTNADLTYISPSIEKITGRSVQEWLNKRDWFITDNKLNDYAKTTTWKHLRGEVTEGSILIEIEHADKSLILLEVYENPIFVDGEVIGLQGVAHDVTQRKRAEEALYKSEIKYRTLFEQSADALLIIKEGKFVDCNSATTEMLGYAKKKELLETHPSQLSPEKQPDGRNSFDKANEMMSTAFAKGSHRFEWLHKRRNGEVFPVEVLLTAIPFEEGKFLHVVWRDITERKQADEEKAKLEAQLRRSQKLETIGTLAGGIAHDFNNILAPIMGFTELALLKIDETEPIANDLKQVLQGVHRAKDLVEQILLFSKQSEKERQPLALQSVVKEALKLLRPSIPTTIEIQQRLDDSCPKVRADATQIHQVLVNLCANAWQAMEGKSGTLSIELNQIKIDAALARIHPNLNQEVYARLSVIDTGSGMDATTLERIFEPFFTTKTVDKGTGLGLSVVHGIVRSHKGDIQVYSEPGKGTTFHVYLPAIVSEMETVEITSKEIKGGNESILIVDDETAIAEMVQTILNNFGYKTEICNNAATALEAFKQKPEGYDLLISDLTMPQMTGLDLADKLHKERPELPIVIMTGFGDNLTQASQQRYGVKHVLSKPVAVKELAIIIRKVLDNSSSKASQQRKNKKS